MAQTCLRGKIAALNGDATVRFRPALSRLEFSPNYKVSPEAWSHLRSEWSGRLWLPSSKHLTRHRVRAQSNRARYFTLRIRQIASEGSQYQWTLNRARPSSITCVESIEWDNHGFEINWFCSRPEPSGQPSFLSRITWFLSNRIRPWICSYRLHCTRI